MTDMYEALTASYRGTPPSIGADLAFAGYGAAVLGRSTLGARAWLGAMSVMRGDGDEIEAGDDFHLGNRGTVHIAHDMYPTRIGDGVTVGDGAVIHACDVGHRCVVEPGAVILDGASVGAQAVIGEGSVVFPRSTLDGGWLYSGIPAKPVAKLTPEQLEECHQKIRGAAAPSPTAPKPAQTSLDCFVAPTANVSGAIDVGADASIWYGCHLDAGSHRITVGDRTNIQDNTTMLCEKADVVLAENVTLGHNVTMTDCTVGANSLIGIGSTVAPGTVVENDVLLAAGARTEPGQVLTAGHVWAGAPAKILADMDDNKRALVALTLPMYIEYANTFVNEPHLPLIPGTQ